MIMQRESVLFISKQEPTNLRYTHLVQGSVHLYYEYGDAKRSFTEDTDFTVDYEGGTILILSDAVPLYQNSGFYQKDPFNHTKFASYGNYPFMCHVDYEFSEIANTTDDELAAEISRSSIKLEPFTQPFRYAVFGDSISTGAEASHPAYMYFSLFTNAMQQKYGVEVECIQAAVGGDSSTDGLIRMEKDVLSHRPDLVTIAFGMNDQNRERGQSRHTSELIQYEANIRQMIHELQQIGSKIILVSPCYPNLRWYWASGDTALYAEVLKKLAKEYQLPIADVTALWNRVLGMGKSAESLLYNDINHPTDYGHSLYAAMLKSLL